MRTSEEVNAGIEKINALLSEISSIGWDICHYFEEKYSIESYDWEEKIPDKNAAWIAQQANNCGMIQTWNEFGFGESILADDGVLEADEEWLLEFLMGREDRGCGIDVWADIANTYDIVERRNIEYICIDGYDEVCVEDAEHNEYFWGNLTPESKIDIIDRIRKEYGEG